MAVRLDMTKVTKLFTSGVLSALTASALLITWLRRAPTSMPPAVGAAPSPVTMAGSPMPIALRICPMIRPPTAPAIVLPAVPRLYFLTPALAALPPLAPATISR